MTAAVAITTGSRSTTTNASINADTTAYTTAASNDNDHVYSIISF